MSISFERKGKWVNVQTFFTKEVIEYLTSKLNTNQSHFKVSAKPKFCKCVMAKFEDVNFIICAEKTWIEISFDKANAEKMTSVIDEITKWEQFSKTEKTFYIEIEDGDSCTIIFENGYATCEEYRRHFKNSELKITIF